MGCKASIYQIPKARLEANFDLVKNTPTSDEPIK